MKTETILKAPLLIVLSFGAAACQPLTPDSLGQTPQQSRGLAFAWASCGGCHSVERVGLSSNADAPPFAQIVNQEGLTQATLASWLRDAHNYPAEMEFRLEGSQVDDLVSYMLALRNPNYRPAI